MLLYAGRAHDPMMLGVEATKDGECAVECPICPQPGRNAPEKVADIPASGWYVSLYEMLLTEFNSESLCAHQVDALINRHT